jgi:hypothetical protein
MNKKISKFFQGFKEASWIPTRGNVVFTILIAVLLISTQKVWAKGQSTSLSSVGANAMTVNYQGSLADSNGSPLSGTFDIRFSLFDALEDGTMLWSEDHTNVAVSNGLFSVGLGSLTTGGLPLNLWGDDRFLEIAINGDALRPREPIRSVPLAGMALTVPNGSITSDQLADGSVTLSKLGQDVNLTVPNGSITAEKIANGGVPSEKVTLNYFKSNPFLTEIAINTTFKNILSMNINVPYDMNCLVIVNTTTAVDVNGIRVMTKLFDNSTQVLINHTSQSVSGNNGTETTTSSIIIPLLAGAHTINLDAATATSSGRVRGAEIIIIPFAAPALQ